MIQPDERFRLEGNDLYTIVPVSPWEAALGAKIPVETMNGSPSTLTVPRGSQNGRRLRLRGKGMPKKQGSAGDLIVDLDIHVQKNIIQQERTTLCRTGSSVALQTAFSLQAAWRKNMSNQFEIMLLRADRQRLAALH